MLRCMEITAAQYLRLAPSLPRPRGNVRISNRQVLNALLYVAEQGCQWRGLPKRFGNWHTLYTRLNRWSQAGVLDSVWERLPREQIGRLQMEAVKLDSTTVQVHPDGRGALKKTVRRPSENPAAEGPPRFLWLPRMLARPYRLPSRRARPPTRSKAATAERHRTAARPVVSHPGPSLGGQPDPPTGSGFWLPPGDSSSPQSPASRAVR